MNKKTATVLIVAFLCLATSVHAEDKYRDIISTERRIQELVDEIKSNLLGTSIYTAFIEEQNFWLQYRDAHLRTLFPEYIDGIKMQWGSILSYAISQVLLQMNLDRIRILESYLYTPPETGTDGKGKFKEYVNELRRK